MTAISSGFVETGDAVQYHKSEDGAASIHGEFPVLQPQDAAHAVVYALIQPPHVQVHDVLIRPTEQVG